MRFTFVGEHGRKEAFFEKKKKKKILNVFARLIICSDWSKVRCLCISLHVTCNFLGEDSICWPGSSFVSKPKRFKEHVEEDDGNSWWGKHNPGFGA